MKLETNKNIVGSLRYYNYIIEIQQDNKNNIFEYWIYKEDTGIKMLMFGIDSINLEIIQNQIEDYIKLYNEQYVYN